MVLWRFWAARHISRAKLAEINRYRQRKLFLALNVDFVGSSFDCLGSRKPAHEGIE